ncbi:MAG: hypothetical protein FWE45_03210 [Firmicutes bacterium]|nr:hypothetical protein [Bacillota bacterium]
MNKRNIIADDAGPSGRNNKKTKNALILGMSGGFFLIVALVFSLLSFRMPIGIEAAAVVGDKVDQENISIRILDGSLPSSNNFWGFIPHFSSSETTDHPVELTFTHIDSSTRSITLDAVVPTGYRLVFGGESHSSQARHHFGPVEYQNLYHSIQTGIFSTQISFNNLSLDQFNRIAQQQNTRFHIYIVPITDMTINFNTHGGLAIAPLHISVLHPNVLPTPTKALHPFIQWSATPNGEQLSASQMADGMTVHARWLDAPQVTITNGTNISITNTPTNISPLWSIISRFYWERPNGSDFLLRESSWEPGFDLQNFTNNFDRWQDWEGWVTGAHNIRVEQGLRCVHAWETDFAQPTEIVFTETRQRLQTPTNIRIINNHAVWDTGTSTVEWGFVRPIHYAIPYIPQWNFYLWHSVFDRQFGLEFESISSIEGWLQDAQVNTFFLINMPSWNSEYLPSFPSIEIDINTLPVYPPEQLAAPDPTIGFSGAYYIRFRAVPNAIAYRIQRENIPSHLGLIALYNQNGQLENSSTGLMDTFVMTRNGYHYIFLNNNFEHDFGDGQFSTNLTIQAWANGVTCLHSNVHDIAFTQATPSAINIENVRLEDSANGRIFNWNARDLHFLLTTRFDAFHPNNFITARLNGGPDHQIRSWEAATFGLHSFSNFEGFDDGEQFTLFLSVPGRIENGLLPGSGTFTLTFEEPTLPITAPTISLNENRVSWTWITGATRFDIFNGVTRIGQVTNSSTPFFDLNRYTLGIGSHEIRVQTIADGVNFIDSVLSNTVTFVVEPAVLNRPINLFMLQDEALIWETVVNPVNDGFEIEVIGHGTMTTVANQISIEEIVEYLELGYGTFQVRVRALSNNEFFTHSAWSDNFEFVLRAATSGGFSFGTFEIIAFASAVNAMFLLFALVYVIKRMKKDDENLLVI